MAKVTGTAGKVVVGANVTVTGATGTTDITITGVTTQTAGDKILIEDVGGMTDINGEHTVDSVNTGTDLHITIATTAQSYTSGGTLKDCATITAWSMDIATDPIQTTDSEVATWHVFIPNEFKGATGTFDVFFETAVTDLVLGSSTTLILRMDASNYYTCTAYLTANTATVDVPGSEAVKKTYSFQTTSTISLTVA